MGSSSRKINEQKKGRQVGYGVEILATVVGVSGLVYGGDGKTTEIVSGGNMRRKNRGRERTRKKEKKGQLVGYDRKK